MKYSKNSGFPYKKSVYIFRRDLRYEDNTALIHALEQSESVIPLFIIDPTQVGQENKYRSNAALQFMTQALEDLAQTLQTKKGKLYCFNGSPEQVVSMLIEREKIQAVYSNCDYTPFSIKRDAKLADLCQKHAVDFHAYHDLLLQAPDTVAKKSGGFYTVFTPFYKALIKMPQEKPKTTRLHNFYTKPIPGALSSLHEAINYIPNKKTAINGTRAACLAILNNLQHYGTYDTTRDIPALDATTHLSAYIKFGICSIREAYDAIYKTLGKNHTLIKQLCWHDFFTSVAFHNPHVFGAPFHKKYANLPWNTNKQVFTRWRTGTTGFPIVDAGIRELISTGFMHNRIRMVTASFLIKDLHIDWREGERFFASHLVDYDPSVNNGNWQWVASTGCDAQPYFRIFNPWLQQKKYDKDCIYIKRWIPELKDIPAKEIHHWYKNYTKYTTSYPPPMVDHNQERIITQKIWLSIA